MKKAIWLTATLGVLSIRLFAATTLQSDLTQLYFGPVGSGDASTAETVNFQNIGTSVINNIAFSISGADATDFAYTTTCGTSLQNNAKCSAQVTFVAGSTGVRTATLSFVSTAVPSPFSVALQGIGLIPDTTALTVDFPNVEATVPLGSHTILAVTPQYRPNSFIGGITTVPPLTIASVQVSGPNASDYQVSIGTLNYGAPIAALVTFTPSAVGVRTATLSINTNEGSVSASLNESGADASTTLSLSTNALSFGSEGVNTNTTVQPFSLEATGTSPVNVNTVAISGADPGDFTLSDMCSGKTLLPADVVLAPSPGADSNVCSIGIVFNPAAAGTRTATLTVTANDTGSPHSISLSGTGVSSGSSLLVGSFQPVQSTTNSQGFVPPGDFGSAVVGVGKTITTLIANTSATTAVTVMETISGANASDFSLNPISSSSDCAVVKSLAPNSACPSTIGFIPSASGFRTAILTVSNSQSGISQNFILTGVGVAGSKYIVFQPTGGAFEGTYYQVTSNDFGTAAIGTTNRANIAFQNAGTETVVLSGAYFTGPNPKDFVVTSYSCTHAQGVLLPGDTCTAVVNFTPTGEGYRTATLNLFDDAQNGVQTFGVTGAGVPPPAQNPVVYPSAYDFSYALVGTTAYTNSPIIFTNIGSGYVGITNLTVSGPNASDFAVVGGCPAHLLPGYQCEAAVQFTPSVSGSEIAYLTFVNDSQYGNVVVALYGYGQTGSTNQLVVTPAAIDFGPPALDFGAFAEPGVSQANIQVSNLGGGNLQILSTSITGMDSADFSTSYQLNAPTCNHAVDFTSCTIPVSFYADSTGPKMASLSIATNAGTVTVPLIGSYPVPASGLRYQQSVGLSAMVGQTVEFAEVIFQTGSYAASYSPTLGSGSSDFSVGTLYCPTGSSYPCTLPILFTPSHAGTQSATINLTPHAMTSALIQLTGTGN